MKSKLKSGMTLVALVFVAGGISVMLSQRDGDFPIEGSAMGHSLERGRLGKVSSVSPAAGRYSFSGKHSQDQQNDLSTEDEARLRALEAGDVAICDIPDALQFIKSLPDRPEIQELMVALVRQWTESDAPTAARWAEDLPVGARKQECINGVALVWSNQDLDKTIKWAMSLPEEDERNEVLRNVAYEAASTQPLAALDIAAALPTSQENNALIQHATLQWASVSPAEAAEWANGIPDQDLRQRALSQVATAWSESDPHSAATMALSDIPPGRAQDDAIIGIVQRWVQTDPAAASAWVATFPDGTLRETASEAIAKLRP